MQKVVADIQHSLRPSQWVLLLCGFPAAFHTNAPLVSDAPPCFGALLWHGGQRCHTLFRNKARKMNSLFPYPPPTPSPLRPALTPALGITAVEIEPAP